MSIHSNLAFGSRLRAHRERRGLTIAALADSLKTKQSLLAELERDDVTRWPPGIYGRALVREYAKLVGLPPEEIVQQFVELFGAVEEREAGSGPERQDAVRDELRLTFAHAPVRHHESLSGRVIAASVELLVVVTIGFIVSLISGASGWTTNAMIALSWYPARTAFGVQDAFYRILRLQGENTSSMWSRRIGTEPAENLVSPGRTVADQAVDSADEPLIAESDVNAATSSSASVH